MSAARTFPLMTIEEFESLPEPKGNFTYELHFGRLVRVGRAKIDHYLLQCIIRELLKGQVDSKKWFIDIEMPFSLVEGFDARAADVGVILKEKLKKALPVGYLNVSPELVIFIKSRSNGDVQIEKDAIECLTHGAEAAWYVKHNPDLVFVYTAAGKKEYRPGQSIPLPRSMGGASESKISLRPLAI